MELLSKIVWLFLIIRWTVLAISIRCFRLRLNKFLCPVICQYVIDESQYPSLQKAVDNVVKLMIFWRRKRCFYNSFVMANILRQSGRPIKINFGFISKNKMLKQRAHCWLTLDGELLFEPEETEASFPYFMGEISEGNICYWLGEPDDAIKLSHFPQ